MRRAVLIVGLLVGISMFFRSIFLALVAGNAKGVPGAITVDPEILEEAENLYTAAGGGFIAAVIVLVAAGLAIINPRASTVLFLIAAVIAIPIGATTEFSGLMFWGALSIFCAFLSFFGHLKVQRRPPIAVRSNRASKDSSEGVATGASSQNFCTNCGKSIQPDHNYCVGCGTELS